LPESCSEHIAALSLTVECLPRFQILLSPYARGGKTSLLLDLHRRTSVLGQRATLGSATTIIYDLYWVPETSSGMAITGRGHS
jgi:hypothetical protein